MSGHPFGFLFGEPDPEAVAQARRAHDQMHMQHDMIRHEAQSFVDNMSEHQLVMLRHIVGAASGDENYGNFLQGHITALLHVKYGICTACGKNHDRELLGNPTPEQAAERLETAVDEAMEATAPFADGTEQPPMFEGTPAEIAAAQADLEIENMKKWDLRYPEERDFNAGLEITEGGRPVFCNACGMLYQSLADRMLRPPGIDGCFGCQMKSAHG